MKKIMLICFCLLAFTCVSLAQRYGIVDTRYILDKMPEYNGCAKEAGPVQHPMAKGD